MSQVTDLYTPSSDGFEGSASDHIKNDMQVIKTQIRELVGDRLRSINFWISASSYGDDEIDGSFELSVNVDSFNYSDKLTYKHTAPSLDAALAHVVRHIETDMAMPEIASGSFYIPKLIASE